MKATDLNVSSLQICTGSTEYRFPAKGVVDVCIRADKPFRLYVCSEKHGKVCIGPSSDGDLSFDGRFRMVEAEWFAVHSMKSANLGVRILEIATSPVEQPDPRRVEIPLPVPLTTEQKIALEVERRLSGDRAPGTPMAFLDEEDNVDWDDWSPYMESEEPLPQSPPPDAKQSPQDNGPQPVKPEAAEQPAQAGEVDNGTAS